MPVTPTGLVSLPLKLTQDLICACETFRTEVGAANAAAAAAYVFWDEAFPSNGRPWALITDNDRVSEKISNASWETEGRIVVQFDFPVTTYSPGTQDNEDAKTFRNKMGAIEAEMKAAILATPSAYVDIRAVRGPEVLPPDPDNNAGEKFWSGYFELDYKAAG